MSCTLVSDCINAYSMDLDNSEMIASLLVFSVHVKVYGLWKWELAGVSYPTNGVVNGVRAVCLEYRARFPFPCGLQEGFEVGSFHDCHICKIPVIMLQFCELSGLQLCVLA